MDSEESGLAIFSNADPQAAQRSPTQNARKRHVLSQLGLWEGISSPRDIADVRLIQSTGVSLVLKLLLYRATYKMQSSTLELDNAAVGICEIPLLEHMATKHMETATPLEPRRNAGSDEHPVCELGGSQFAAIKCYMVVRLRTETDDQPSHDLDEELKHLPRDVADDGKFTQAATADQHATSHPVQVNGCLLHASPNTSLHLDSHPVSEDAMVPLLQTGKCPLGTVVGYIPLPERATSSVSEVGDCTEDSDMRATLADAERPLSEWAGSVDWQQSDNEDPPQRQSSQQQQLEGAPEATPDCLGGFLQQLPHSPAESGQSEHWLRQIYGDALSAIQPACLPPFDDTVAAGAAPQHEPPQLLGDSMPSFPSGEIRDIVSAAQPDPEVRAPLEGHASAGTPAVAAPDEYRAFQSAGALGPSASAVSRSHVDAATFRWELDGRLPRRKHQRTSGRGGCVAVEDAAEEGML